MTQELLTLTADGTPVIDSLTIAEGCQVQHKNVLELIRKYLPDFQAFGAVAFETRPFETAGGTQKRDVALLNEDQATLLFTYLKNTEIARPLKVRVVKAFRNCRDELAKAKAVPTQFQIPQTMQEALRLAADQMDKNVALQLENQKLSDKTATLENKIEADKHKVGFYDDCADTTDLYLGTEVASRLNVKRPFFFNYCFNRGIIQRHNKRWMSTAKYRGKKWVFDVIKPFKHPTSGEQKDGDQLYFSMLGMRGIYDMMKEENVSGLNPQPDLFKETTK